MESVAATPLLTTPIAEKAICLVQQEMPLVEDVEMDQSGGAGNDEELLVDDGSEMSSWRLQLRINSSWN